MLFNINRRRRAAINIVMLGLAMLTVAVSLLPVKADEPDRYYCSLFIEPQQAALTYPNGTSRNVQIQGLFEGQRDGTASGNIQVTDGQTLYNFDVMNWSGLTFDANGILLSVDFSVVRTVYDPNGGEVTDTITVVQTQLGLDLGDYSIAPDADYDVCASMADRSGWPGVECCSYNNHHQLIGCWWTPSTPFPE